MHTSSPHSITITLRTLTTDPKKGFYLSADISKTASVQEKPSMQLTASLMAEFGLANGLNRTNWMPV